MRMQKKVNVDTRGIDYTNHATKCGSRRFEGRTNRYLEQVRVQGLARAVAGIRRGDPVLDVGCGTGRGLAELFELGFTSLTGLDFTGR